MLKCSKDELYAIKYDTYGKATHITHKESSRQCF